MFKLRRKLIQPLGGNSLIREANSASIAHEMINGSLNSNNFNAVERNQNFIIFLFCEI